MCTSSSRLVSAVTGPRLPPTQEAQAKVTKILDSAFYSIGRLLPEDSPEKGESPPSEGQVEEEKKGDTPPKKRTKAKEEAAEVSGKDSRTSRRSPPQVTGVSPYLQPKEEGEKEDKGVSTTPKRTEDRRPLPRRREEEKEPVRSSRTPKRRQEKEKKRRRREDSRSGELSGSEVRKQKREVADSQKEKKEKAEETVVRDPAIEREPHLRPRPTQRQPRSPHTPERPPPGRSSGSKGGSKGKSQGSGWRGKVPYSSHPRWTQGTNKGITKRAKQELQERKSYGRGGRYRW